MILPVFFELDAGFLAIGISVSNVGIFARPKTDDRGRMAEDSGNQVIGESGVPYNFYDPR